VSVEVKHKELGGVSGSIRDEEARIRAAYARRVGDGRYSWFNPSYVFIMQQLEHRLLNLLRATGSAPFDSRQILEIGCGTGHWLREFIKWGASPENVTGIDLLADRIAMARRLCPGGVRLECGSAAQLPFSESSYDLVLQSTVFTSILDHNMRKAVAAEMVRVVRPNGVIIWYDYHVNNPWNRDVRGVKRSEIRKLFPECQIELQRMTLLPPLARLLAPYSLLACYLLEKIPPLCTHYLGVIRKT
jgi:ubiquinone/menaquinone biosynthesis C-methylase UbiE